MLLNGSTAMEQRSIGATAVSVGGGELSILSWDLRPSGVNSSAQANYQASGKPSATRTINTFNTHSVHRRREQQLSNLE